MAHSCKELLCLATGAIDRALPLLQDPVLLTARILPPALSIFTQLNNSLTDLMEELATKASASGGLGEGMLLSL